MTLSKNTNQEAASELSGLSLHEEPEFTFGYDPNFNYATLSPEQWDQPPLEGTLETILEQPEEDHLMSATHV